MCWAAALSFSVRRVHAGAGPCARHGWHVVRQVGTLHVALKHRQATHPAVGAVRLTDVRLETVGGVSGGCFFPLIVHAIAGGLTLIPAITLALNPVSTQIRPTLHALGHVVAPSVHAPSQPMTPCT